LTEVAEAPVAPPPPAPVRRLWWPLRWLAWSLFGLLALAAAAVFTLDTDFGHRFITDRIARIAPSSGLRIHVGRIDGTLWGTTELRDVRLSDPQGVFLEFPEIALRWHPLAWLRNKLDIDSVTTDLAVLHRLPKLKPSTKQGPILPGFDIRIGKLDVRTLRIEPAVTGTRRIGRIVGKADIHRGRALIDLAAATNGGDRLRLLLDAEPDRDKFELGASLLAPAGGVIGKLAGTEKPMQLAIGGKGTWKIWDGSAKLDVARQRIIDLGLGVRGGTYSLGGMIAPASITSGKIQRLSSPRFAVTGRATLAERRLDTKLTLRSGALAIDAKGVLDLAQNAFERVNIYADLLKPPALFPNMTGRNVKLRMTLEGAFSRAAFDYALTAERAAFDQTGFEEVRAQGKGHFGTNPVLLPIRLTARRVTGVGDVAGGILANLSVQGVLKVTARELTGEGLTLNSDKLKGKLALLVNLVTGDFTVNVSGGLTRYLIPGLGLVDVLTELKVVPGPGGKGSFVQGRGRAWVRRFDNAFLNSLAGGLPTLDTGLVRGSDGILLLRGLKLTAPGISITGNGQRFRDGNFHFQGSGKQGQYGPFTILLDGNISRPKLDLVLASPANALGLADVKLSLDPNAQGYAYRAAGGSTLGPFTSNGQILMPSGGSTTIGVAALDVGGTHASGALRSEPGGFVGRLGVSGGGLDGGLLFKPVVGVQEIDVKLAAQGAVFAGPPPTSVRRGTIDGTIRLDPAGTGIKGTVTALGLKRGGFSIARLTASADLIGGNGKARFAIAGSRGRSFELVADADLAPDRMQFAGGGTVDRQPLRLTSPAVLTRDGDGWRLASTALSFAGGTAKLSGRFAPSGNQIDAGVDHMPLTVLDIFAPRLGLGGSATGHFAYATMAGGTPSGSADLKISGLTRSGLVLSSRPIDVGLAAKLDNGMMAARALMASNGQAIGRAQMRLAPLPPGSDLMTRLTNAPLFAQLRYAGPADTLWRLTGIETIDLSGPVAIGADVGGTLSNPLIKGSLRTDGARLESAVTGTVITQLKAAGRFGGSKLTLDQFSGATSGGGTVTGHALFDLAAANGFGMDLAIDAKDAMLLNRDDIAARVTGPLSLKSDGMGGTIAGDVHLEKGRFRLGRAAAAAIPRLNVTEINRPADEMVDDRPPVPWKLDLHANARNQLAVSGLGLDSEWRADLTIKGTVDNPAISGRADLVRGSYDFAGRRFDLDRGLIRFLGEAPPDPVLDIVAKASIQGLNATISVSGTGQKPDINFQSTPALPEDELLSRLLFGTSITNLSAPEALQLAAAVASLRGGGGGGLNPINAVRRVAGLDRLRILPADVTTGQKTSIAAGKYVGRRTYVEVVTDGQGYSATNVEFQVTRWLSLLATVSTIGRQSANVRVSKDY
jgi:translocation and assembly module TamB